MAIAILIAAAPGAVQIAAQQLRAGPNVNMASGPVKLTVEEGTGKILEMLGDPFTQRRNEPSLQCAPSDPQFCMAAANDMRLVKAPGLPDGRVTGDAWLAYFWTNDGGKTWKSRPLPGFIQDGSPEGLASPIRGFDAAADPTVRVGGDFAGGADRFYVSGIAFNRAETANVQSSVLSGSEGKRGVAFISVFRDPRQPNAEPIYEGTYIVDDGNSGLFLDKTWITIGLPTQTVPCGPIYFAQTVFTGSGTNNQSKLMVKRSNDCAKTWPTQNTSKVSEGFAINQSGMLAINPKNGHVLLTWRVFGTQNGNTQNQILFTSSPDGRKWNTPTVIDSFGTNSNNAAPDQGTLPSEQSPNFRMFRSNMYPSICATVDGNVWIAYSKRIPNEYEQAPQGYARIFVRKGTVQQNGTLSGTNERVDTAATEGNQLMPAAACHGTRVTVAWLDQKEDSAPKAFGGWAFQAGDPLVYLFGSLIWDLTPPPPTHTLDVRAARTSADGTFGPSIQVSRYPMGRFPTPGSEYPYELRQLQYFPPNWPLFRGRPFIGDYISAESNRSIVAYTVDGKRGYRYFGLNPDGTLNTAEIAESPVVHLTWADNREVIPSFFRAAQPDPNGQGNLSEPADAWVTSDGQLEQWQPPAYTGITTCNAGGPPVANKRQSIFNAVVTDGFQIGAVDENRQVGNLRGFSIYLTNTTSVRRRFRVSTDNGSFSYLDATKSTIDIDIPGGNARGVTVFLRKPEGATQLPRTVVTAQEIDLSLLGAVADAYVFLNLRGTAILNPAPGDVSTETRGLTLGLVSLAGEPNSYYTGTGTPIIDPGSPIIDPGTPIIDPGTPIIDPGTPIIDPGTPIIDPGTPIIDPGTPIIDPGTPIIDPGTPIIDPGSPIIDPGSSVPTIDEKELVTQVTTTTTNTGNVATSVDIAAYIASLPEDVLWQLLVARLYTVTTTYPTSGDPCAAYAQRRLDVVTNIATTQNQQFTSLVLGKGESAALILRFYHNEDDNFNLSSDPNELRKQLTITVASQGPSTDVNGNIVNSPPTVMFGNHAPVADDVSVSATEDEDAAITLDATDEDTGDVLTYTVVDGPTHGTLSGTGANLTYTPNANYFGPDGFTYKANDGALDSNVATVTIDVTAVNDPPVANDGAAATPEDTAVTIGLGGSDVEGSALTFSIVSGPSKGTLALAFPNVTYTPNANANGSDSFTFKVNDGAADSNVATVIITVAPVNDPPTATPASVTTPEDTALGITLTGSDVDGGTTLTFQVVTGPSNGTLGGVAPNVTYTPNANYFGADSFTFRVFDGAVYSGNATVAIAVTPVNDAPVANPDTATATSGGMLSITVLANDSDIDDPITNLRVAEITSAPTHGTAVISVDGKTVNYTPDETYAGSDSFTYKAKDAAGALSADAATVNVTNRFAFNGLLGSYQPPPKKSHNLGSSVPVVWQYRNASNVAIDSSGYVNVLAVTFVKLIGATLNTSTCLGGTEDPTTKLENKDFPGNSFFQYFTTANPHPTAGANTWQFNWQTSAPVTRGCWAAKIILDLNGDGIYGNAGDQVNDKSSVDGSPLRFLIK